MSVDTTLAQMSNVLVYSSMAAYSVALVGYAVDLSGRGARPRSEQKVLVGAGAPDAPAASEASATGPPPAAVAPRRSRPPSPGWRPACTSSPC